MAAALLLGSDSCSPTPESAIPDPRFLGELVRHKVLTNLGRQRTERGRVVWRVTAAATTQRNARAEGTRESGIRDR